MVTKILARFVLWLFGWKVKMVIPPLKKYVIIIAPHTSNLDFFIGKLANWSCGQKCKTLVKKEAFKFFVAPIIRMWGGVPIDRKDTVNIVDQVTKYFKENDEFVLGITPEGTRKLNPEWKTGFYRIALNAHVPIYFGYIDFGTKKVGMHDFLMPTGNMEKEIAEIKAYYKDMKGYRQNQFAV